MIILIKNVIKGVIFMGLSGYMRGLNFGHWISQYGELSDEHFSNFIVESDFEQVAKWGFDHIRLPIDYPVFYDEKTGEFIEKGLKYADFAIQTAKKYGLNVILDLHRTPGYSFDDTYDKEKNSLFHNKKQQEIFISIWQMFAKRYINEGDNLYFELLNELVQETSDPWNELWPKAVKAIEEISPNRKILVGSNHWNNPDELKYLKFIDDPNIIYNFHCYAPFLFTHQRAGWNENMVAYPCSVTYPLNVKEHKKFFLDNDPWMLENFETVGKEELKTFLQSAIDFKNEHNCTVYCGEFGVIANADLKSTIRWINDIVDIFNENGIGHSAWSYRGFAKITDENRNAVSEEMIKALSK